ncbi:MAG: 16S rRNA (cytidine(1402)-2'-O)-methyltransferase [Chloroflexota bacterium]|nr:16S rRNA (cytidine(1402)-2'-O)-methyltransferase [Chloroflexota bacterium]
MGTLYVVGTPIGNLEDITLRALRKLREVSLIAAEDTRTTGRLLSHHEVETPLTSYWEHNKLSKLHTILDALEEGDVALVSEAGMPGLSDPGYKLIHAAIEAGHRVSPIPGPTAPITALVVSGLPTDRFLYLGFLPRRAGPRRRLLAQVAPMQHTLVAFESPHRLLEALEDAEEILGDRQMAMARELTKLHEEIWRGRISQARAHFASQTVRGEFTLVIAGASPQKARWEEERVQAAAEELMEAGVRRREAVKAVARLADWPAREVYQLMLTKEDR